MPESNLATRYFLPSARALHPSLQAALTMQSLNDETFGQLTSDELADSLRRHCEAISPGETSSIDALLATQAFTLDAVFNELARLAAEREDIDQISRLLQLALKAQGECRATLKDLSGAKNPFANAYIQQQNLAFNQQVQNGMERRLERVMDKVSE